jgi:hypothetical protein
MQYPQIGKQRPTDGFAVYCTENERSLVPLVIFLVTRNKTSRDNSAKRCA